MQAHRLERLAGHCARVALVSAILLSLAVLSQAQTATPPPPAPHAAASPTKPAAHPRGNHEGIKVHGHWTIEVKNPDGRLVSHTEFENALVQPSGAATLAQTLLGKIVPGGYLVTLAGSNSQFSPPGPCAMLGKNVTTACYLVGSLISPEPAGFGDSFSECGGTGFSNQISAAGPCFPLNISAGPTGLVFTGTAVANTATPITDVYLSPLNCPQNPAANPGSATSSPNACAQGSAERFDGTHATLPTPVAITSAGQSIAVTVQLSFQ